MLLGLLTLAPAQAGGEPAVTVPAAGDSEAGESLLLFGPAVAGVFDPAPPVMAFMEYRYTTGRYKPGPWLALETTERDLFVGFGLFLDLPFARRWFFTPSVGAAIYREHEGLGLGFPLEFRATAELTCRLDRWRLGASFGHYSHGNLGEANPGTEILKIVWVVPLGRPGPQ